MIGITLPCKGTEREKILLNLTFVFPSEFIYLKKKYAETLWKAK